MALTQVTSAGLKDGEIVNADLHSAAAIALSKLATSGTAGSGNYLRGDGAWSAIDLSTKLNLTGGTLTGNLSLLDNVIVKFGTGDDLQIKHNGSSNKSIIYHSHASGVLSIAADHLNLADYGNEHPFITCDRDGAVELFYDNSKKLETAGGGININGDVYHNTDGGSSYFGADNDLRIYHDGSNSYVNSSTGNLYLYTTTNNSITLGKSGEISIKALPDSRTELYYDNSKKLETRSDGVGITGILNMSSHIYLGDSDYLICGQSNDLQIYHDGSHSYIKDTWNDLRIESDSLALRTTTGGELYIDCTLNGAVELYHNNEKKLYTQSWGVTVADASATTAWLELVSSDGTCGYLVGQSNAGSGSDKAVALYNAAGNETLLRGRNNGGVELYYDNSKKFETYSNGVQISGRLDVSDYINITGGADLYLADNGKANFGTSTDLEIFHDGSNSYIDNDTGILNIQSDSYLYLESNARTYIGNVGMSEVHAIFVNNGDVSLWYDNSKKLETASYGIYVSGISKADNFNVNDSGRYKAGSDDDMQIWHNGSHGNFLNSTGTQYYASTQHHFYNPAFSELQAKFIENGAVELYHNNTKRIETSSSGVTITGNLSVTGSSPGAPALGGAKAWVNVDGDDSTANIRASYNVSSLSDDAYERHTVNFSTNFSNTNYCFVTGARAGGSGGGGRVVVGYDAPATSYFKYQMRNLSNNNEHVDAACLAFFGT